MELTLALNKRSSPTELGPDGDSLMASPLEMLSRISQRRPAAVLISHSGHLFLGRSPRRQGIKIPSSSYSRGMYLDLLIIAPFCTLFALSVPIGSAPVSSSDLSFVLQKVIFQPLLCSSLKPFLAIPLSGYKNKELLALIFTSHSDEGAF